MTKFIKLTNEYNDVILVNIDQVQVIKHRPTASYNTLIQLRDNIYVSVKESVEQINKLLDNGLTKP